MTSLNNIYFISRFTVHCAILALLVFFVSLPAAAAEPVEVVVTGIEGDVLANVREALALPPGLVREGAVDRLWLERFVRQAEGKVRTAMEPFGYYSPRVEVASETADRKSVV